MIEITVGLAFLAGIAFLGLAMYSRGRKYEETRRLRSIATSRMDDLEWTLGHTTAAYYVQNQKTNAE